MASLTDVVAINECGLYSSDSVHRAIDTVKAKLERQQALLAADQAVRMHVIDSAKRYYSDTITLDAFSDCEYEACNAVASIIGEMTRAKR